MKHVLSVDVEEKKGEYWFDIQEGNKRNIVKANSLGEGFKKVMDLIKKDDDENQTSNQNGKRSEFKP